MGLAYRTIRKTKQRKTLRKRFITRGRVDNRKNPRDDRLARIQRKNRLQQLLLDDLTVIVENVSLKIF
jgi:hypothetical protein|tara:strand:- start:1064 stop:1267 length:204 start_codon:yes stop_codon:yes gene_type:complete